MTAELILYVLVGFTIFEFILTKYVGYLNTLNWSNKLPKELKDIYDEEKYKKSMKYEKEKHNFGMISGAFSFFIIMCMLLLGGFAFVDNLVRSFIVDSEIITSLVFFLVLIVAQLVINLPFGYYSTFVIEEKYGFNKTTKRLFFIDMIKSILLSLIIGGVIAFLVIWIYMQFQSSFWYLAWILITGFSIFFMMFYSSLIVPLFNKQTPLEKGELRDSIEAFAKKVGFKLDNIFVIDGSKRSAKANAYFSGLGSKKRIVLYDTLISDLTVKELVGVLAHEIGHYKRKHTLQMLLFSTIQTGFMLFLLGLLISYPEVSMALGAEIQSFHMGVIAFIILFSPISIILGILGNVLSRRNEYQADEFAGKNYGTKELQSALIKLSRNNLSNLRPHPVYEFFHYSHPTVLKRLNALSKLDK